MIEPELEEKLERKVDRANKVIKVSMYGVVALMLASLVLIVIQLTILQQTQERNLETIRRDGVANHQQTQKYVKCIADVLLKPLVQRTGQDFADCGIHGAVDNR